MTLEQLLDDIYRIRGEGRTVTGIEMGSHAWFDTWRRMAESKPFGTTITPPAIGHIPRPGSMLYGLPLTVVESLGSEVNFLVDPMPGEVPAVRWVRSSCNAGWPVVIPHTCSKCGKTTTLEFQQPRSSG